MKGEIQNSVQKGSRWLRVGVLTLTMAGPIVNTLLKRLLQRSQSLRERPGSTFWALFGFSLGLVGAAVVTYLFIRRRMIEEEAEQSQPIELPPDQELYVADMSRPAGEILHIDNDGADVVILEADGTDVDNEGEVSSEAAFVGVVSTKYYYPVDISLDHLSLSDDKAQDLVYFMSEEDARAQGFTAAE